MNLCFKPADILLPKDTDMTKWSVVACDQYTSQPEYWEKAEEIVGTSLSTLRLTLPEIFLEDDDVKERIANINSTMQEYLPLMKEYKNSLIYVRRTQANGKVRCGIVGMVDLEDYDYSKGSTSAVRATEATVLERIPPRVKVRENAILELPHIMLLIDDKDKTVIEPLQNASGEKVYSFPLMQGGGYIEGRLLTESETENVMSALNILGDNAAFNKRYGTENAATLLFAVGDGNHSLATAKACYENLKKSVGEEKAKTMPARYALAEVVNLHDESLEFEAIHRVLFGCDKDDLLDAFEKFCENNKGEFPAQTFTVYFEGGEKDITVNKPISPLTIGTLQKFLDEYMQGKDIKIDYIHGEDVTKSLGQKPGNMGFVLPTMQKNELFPTVIHDGVLPRKTFSMGEAHDKRFYLESRKIK